GARVASTPDRAAQGEVLCSMLANDQAVRAVILDSGLLDAMDRGTVHVNHATISVALAQELAAEHARRGLKYVAAPVFGRPDMTTAAKLNILAAGEPGAIEQVRPLLEAMGSRVWPLGEAPERAYGVSAADFLEVMTNTLFAAPAYQGYGRLIAEQRFKPAGFPLPLGFKDVGLA